VLFRSVTAFTPSRLRRPWSRKSEIIGKRLELIKTKTPVIPSRVD
jgi:hypothetical protein